MTSILIVSSGNSVRSQMAEGWMRYYGGKDVEVFSAGVFENRGINGLTHQLMVDAVIDLSQQTSDKIEKFEDRTFDFLILLHPIDEKEWAGVKANKVLEHFLPDALNSGKKDGELVQLFLEIRNNLDDYCFNFINDNIRKLIPEF